MDRSFGHVVFTDGHLSIITTVDVA